MVSQSRSKFITHIPQYFFLLAALWAGISAIILVNIPGDPKNAWLYGFSKTRLGLLVLMAIITFACLGLALLFWRKQTWSQSLVEKLEWLSTEYGNFPALMIFALVIFALGPYIYLLIRYPLEGFNLRIFPLIFFLTLLALQTLVILMIFARNRPKGKDHESEAIHKISINPKKVSIVLVSIMVFFILTSFSNNLIELAGYAPELSRYTNKLDLDVESNIPTFFSSFLLFSAGVLMGVIAWLHKRDKIRFRWAWNILAGIFIYLAVDESTKLHELLTPPLRAMFKTSGFFTYAWVLAAIPLVIILGIIFLPFLLNLSVKTRRLFIIAAVLYVGGAVGMEIIGAGYIANFGIETIGYKLLSTLEESLEISGLIVLIYALLDYIGLQFQGQEIVISNQSIK